MAAGDSVDWKRKILLFDGTEKKRKKLNFDCEIFKIDKTAAQCFWKTALLIKIIPNNLPKIYPKSSF